MCVLLVFFATLPYKSLSAEELTIALNYTHAHVNNVGLQLKNFNHPSQGNSTEVH